MKNKIYHLLTMIQTSIYLMNKNNNSFINKNRDQEEKKLSKTAGPIVDSYSASILSSNSC